MLKLQGHQDITKDVIFMQALKGWRKEVQKVDVRHPISFLLLGMLISS